MLHVLRQQITVHNRDKVRRHTKGYTLHVHIFIRVRKGNKYMDIIALKMKRENNRETTNRGHSCWARVRIKQRLARARAMNMRSCRTDVMYAQGHVMLQSTRSRGRLTWHASGTLTPRCLAENSQLGVARLGTPPSPFLATRHNDNHSGNSPLT